MRDMHIVVGTWMSSLGVVDGNMCLQLGICELYGRGVYSP